LCSSVMLQSVQRYVDPLRCKQEQLFLGEIPTIFVECIEQIRIPQRADFALALDVDFSTITKEFFELVNEVPSYGLGSGEFARYGRVVLRPGPEIGDFGIKTLVVDGFHHIAGFTDVLVEPFVG